jgi:GTP-binding protein Era
MSSAGFLSENSKPDFKSGFVAILGAPNAGKSTLLNRILGQKISITSRKPQTTRNSIRGVLHLSTSQMVFWDTPGVHHPRDLFTKRIVSEALSVIETADVILFIIDAFAPDIQSEKVLLKAVKKTDKPVILCINKTDRVKNKNCETLQSAWQNAHDFQDTLLISAKHGTRVTELIDAIEKCLPYGPPFFPEDAVTDAPVRFLASEIIREKIFRSTGQEIPYSIAVTIDSFKDDPGSGQIIIHAGIHVERQSQKGIIIGKGGKKLKLIGQQARTDIEDLVQKKVYLHLFVKVQKNWSRDQNALRRFGY